MGHGHDVRRGAARTRLHVRACRASARRHGRLHRGQESDHAADPSHSSARVPGDRASSPATSSARPKLAPDALAAAMRRSSRRGAAAMSRLWDRRVRAGAALLPLSRRRLAVPRSRAGAARCAPPCSCGPTCGALGRAFDTRISIGIGSGCAAPRRQPRHRPPARRSSSPGRGLDGMAHAQTLRGRLGDAAAGGAAAPGDLRARRRDSRNWTPRPGEGLIAACSWRPSDPSQESLARDLGVTQQTVASHLARRRRLGAAARR